MRGLLLLVSLASVVLSACAGPGLQSDAEVISRKVATAREHGAYRCAPGDLAKAEAHLEFLQYETDEGDYRRAEYHRTLALKHVDRALANTNPDECADKRVVILEDRDGDGVPDHIDQCPDVPGPAENQGCPWGDRDGDGITDDIDQCPDVPGPPPTGCPPSDRDGDGIPDDEDLCPDEPGPKENKGCPVRDRDGDGIPDDVDQCPDVPGPPPTGCPARVLVEKTATKIEIRQQINFETNKSTIRGAISFEILDQVASVLRSNPELRLVIEGHTDNVGAAEYNLSLSDDRAKSVRRALLERGIAGARLEAIGYGLTRPVAPNTTAAGRAANRRVEFNIVQE